MHTLSICSRERRASAKVTHSVGSVMIKSLGQAFSKACGSRAAPWEPTDKHYLSGYLFAVFRSGELENPIKGVSIWGKGLDAPFSIPERAAHCRLRCHWNYVGRHGADVIRSLSLVDCPVDSRATDAVSALTSSRRSLLLRNPLDRDSNSLSKRAGWRVATELMPTLISLYFDSFHGKCPVPLGTMLSSYKLRPPSYEKNGAVLVHTPLTDSSVHNHYTIIHKSIQQEKKQYEKSKEK